MKIVFKKRYLLILLLLLPIIYIQGYRYTLNNLTDIFNERCDKLQPILEKKVEIAKKYQDSYSASGSSELQIKYVIDLLELDQQTIDFSTPWSTKADKAVDTLGFRFFLAQPIKDKINALLVKFKADLLANQAMLAHFTNPSDETVIYLKKAVENMDEKQRVLDEKVKAASGYSDIRGYWFKLRVPKCNYFQKNNPEIPAINSNITG